MARDYERMEREAAELLQSNSRLRLENRRLKSTLQRVLPLLSDAHREVSARLTEAGMFGIDKS